MKRTLITPDLSEYPSEYRRLIDGATVFDSSCSPEARVIFIDREGGYYLKSAPHGTLQREAMLTRYFHARGLAAEVLSYRSDERDWLLTTRVHGEDLTHESYLAQPERLAVLLGERLRALHELSTEGCPIPDHTSRYLATVEQNYRTGNYDTSSFPDSFGYASAEQAWQAVEQGRSLLKTDTLLHGDYCLPNVMLDRWQFSGFIDLGNGGVGDRHVDLFWGAWTLNFNLHTDIYRDRFFDAYGRDSIEPHMLDVVAACEVFG